ncbi:MAG: MerR family transcriptional regulator [Kiritimatiellae bacterium]|nr:MerR family transcriptional regulator [Kiritimatiellia bacterium]
MKTAEKANRATYTIAEAARRTGYDAETLRYYEREGLLRGIGRKSTRRVYTEENLMAIGLVTCLKKTGMPLKAIKEYVSLTARGDKTIAKRLELMRRHSKEVVRQLEEVARFKDRIDFKVWYYETAMREGSAAIADMASALSRYRRETGREVSF